MHSFLTRVTLLVAICIVVIIMWSNYLKLTQIGASSGAGDANLNFKQHLCSFDSPDALRNIIWSHKAHVEGLVDGSRPSIARLIERGIMKFDVDVVLVGGNYIVSHPATLGSASVDDIARMQSIGELLEQVYESYKHVGLSTPVTSRGGLGRSTGGQQQYFYGPMVSVEPKFSDLRQLVGLIDILESSKMKHHVALIVSDKEHLHFTLQHVRLLSIALPFKSYANPNITVENQFRWHSSHGGLSGVVGSGHRGTDMALLNPSKMPVLFYMPDIKLLSFNEDCTRPGPVVAWIVDSEAELERALSLSVPVHGVISNRPIELLNVLVERYSKLCASE